MPVSFTHPHLSPRQLQILTLAADGLTTTAIAHRLHMCESTVKRHLYVAARRLGTSSRVATVATALRNGLIT